MAEFLYRLKPVRPGMLADGGTAAEQGAVAAHVAYLKELHDAGALRLAGRTDTADKHTFGIVLFEAADATAAAAIMNADPAVLRGVMRATLFPFRTAFG